MREVDTVIAVYYPDNPLCEREAAAAAVAEILNKQVLASDPKAVCLKKIMDDQLGLYLFSFADKCRKT